MADSEERWEDLYARQRQLNAYPYDAVVSFVFRARPALQREAEQRSEALAPAGQPLRALDVGCGSGVHARLLAEAGCDVLGFDPSASAVDYARAEARRTKLEIAFVQAGLADVDLAGPPFHLVIDRCASTHTTPEIIQSFYRRLRAHLAPGARIHCELFSAAHSGRHFGSRGSDGAWYDFSGGLFQPLGRTCFFEAKQVDAVFEGYAIDRKIHMIEHDEISGDEHARWIVEARCE